MAWVPPTIQGQTTLETKVLRTYGIESDTELTTVVTGFLDDTVREYNARMWEFNKRKSTGLTMTADNPEVSLPDGVNTAFAKESHAYLVRVSDSKVQGILTYIPYHRYREMYGDQTFIGSGLPSVYTFRNVNNDGKVTLGPTPNSSVATDYTLTVEYYRRIPSVSGTEDPIESIPELEVPLVYGAMKRLAIHLYGASHSDVAALDTLEQRVLREISDVDRNHPDQQIRFRLADHRRTTSSTARALYIKIQ